MKSPTELLKKEKAIKEYKKKPPRKLKQKGPMTPSTQRNIPFAEIRDDVVVMKDGTLRTVILVSSLNFALKSEEEQKGIINGYVQFLNSVDFELQIVVQSRKLNIDHYLKKLEVLTRQQDNELLRKQTKAYRAFITKLVQNADIMDKKFFVMVPFSPFTKKKKGFFARLQEVLSPASVVKLGKKKFEQYKTEMDRRVSLVTAGLRSIGLQATTLDTQALIELYYNTYNVTSSKQKKIEEINEMQVDHFVD